MGLAPTWSKKPLERERYSAGYVAKMEAVSRGPEVARVPLL